jgi:hypothetical protein
MANGTRMGSIDRLVDRLMLHIPPSVTRSPFEAMLAGIIVIVTPFIVFGPAQPGSIQSVLPRTVQVLWAAVLFFGSVLMLFGLLRNKSLFERMGLQLFGNSNVVYAIVLFYFAQGNGRWMQGLFACATYVALAFACMVRHWAIRRGGSAAPPRT